MTAAAFALSALLAGGPVAPASGSMKPLEPAGACRCGAGVAKRAIRMTTEDRQPLLVRRVDPEFPNEIRERRGSGVAIYEAIVDDRGRLCDPVPLRLPEFEPPWPELRGVIETALCGWRYRPATLRERNVPVRLTITVNILWK